MATKREILLSIMEAAQLLMTTEIQSEQFQSLSDIDDNMWSIIEYAGSLEFIPGKQLDSKLEGKPK